jgi:hypothetical protein
VLLACWREAGALEAGGWLGLRQRGRTAAAFAMSGAYTQR